MVGGVEWKRVETSQTPPTHWNLVHFALEREKNGKETVYQLERQGGTKEVLREWGTPQVGERGAGFKAPARLFPLAPL